MHLKNPQHHCQRRVILHNIQRNYPHRIQQPQVLLTCQQPWYLRQVQQRCRPSVPRRRRQQYLQQSCQQLKLTALSLPPLLENQPDFRPFYQIQRHQRHLQLSSLWSSQPVGRKYQTAQKMFLKRRTERRYRQQNRSENQIY